jgi:hypothetical protein
VRKKILKVQRTCENKELVRIRKTKNKDPERIRNVVNDNYLRRKLWKSLSPPFQRNQQVLY